MRYRGLYKVGDKVANRATHVEVATDCNKSERLALCEYVNRGIHPHHDLLCWEEDQRIRAANPVEKPL
jgi:hypothetical protein